MKSSNLNILFSRILMSLLIGLNCIVVYGQHGTIDFKHLAMPDKFALSSVTSIGQDSLDFIWYGTRNGVFRYDGVEIKDVKIINNYLDSIGHKDIYAIHFDSNGLLWLGSTNGLDVYDSKEGTIKQIKKDDEKPLGFVYCITETTSGTLLFGTHNGIFTYHPATQKIALLHFFQKIFDNKTTLPRVLSLYESKDGKLWIGSTKGLYQLNSHNGTYNSYIAYHQDTNNEQSLRSNTVNVLKEDDYGNLWVGTNEGLDILKKGENHFLHIQIYSSKPKESNVIRALTIDLNKRTWVGTKHGIAVVDTSFNVVQMLQSSNNKYGLVDNKIRSLYTDDNGSVWVGTYFGGVNHWNAQNVIFRHMDKSFCSSKQRPVVNSIVQDADDNIYFGLESEGVSIFNKKENSYNYLLELEAGKTIGITKTLLSEGKKLWIGTLDNGLICYHLETKTYKNYTSNNNDSTGLSSNSILNIVKYNDSLYWVGTLRGGLNLLDVKTDVLKSFTKNNNPKDTFSLVTTSPRALLVDSKNNLWVGGSGGLCVLYRNSFLDRSFKFHKIKYNQKVKLVISSIYEDKAGQIWVGTINNSFFKVVNQQLVAVDLGSATSVYSILEDSNNLWLSSNIGIIKYRIADSTYTVYNHLNDIEPNKFMENSRLLSNDGQIYFGGASGVSIINIESLKRTTKLKGLTKPVITDLLIYNMPVEANGSKGVLNKAIEYTSELTLQHNQNIFTIRFVTPYFIKTVQNAYQYRLLGFNDKWINTTENTVTYTLQQGGDYVFEVRNADPEYWSAGARQLKIYLSPPFFKSKWALLIYFLLIVSLLMAVYWMLQSKTNLKHQLELEANERINQENANEQKLRFFTNISHDFRTPLTLIIGSLQNFIEEFDGTNEQLRKLMAIQRHGNRLLILINELLDFRKMEKKQLKAEVSKANFVDFMKEIYLSFKSLADSENYQFRFSCSETSIEAWFDKDKLERVFYNLLSNAFKFTPKGGAIEIVVVLTDDDIKVQIVDSGVGIAKEHSDKIFYRFYEVRNLKKSHSPKQGTGIGLTIAKNIIALHKGSISVQSEVDKGSTFTVTLPKGCDHFTENEIVDNENNIDIVIPPHEYKQELLNYQPDIDLANIVENKEKKYTILIAEDNAEVALMIKDGLQLIYNIIIAENGVKALKLAIDKQPDIIISDVMMPKMDGIEFCTKIKTNIDTSHIPFVLLTARTSLMHRFDGLESGADEYISKPFYTKELLLKCHNLITSRERMKEKFQSSTLVPTELNSNSSIDDILLKKVIQLIEKNIGNEIFNVQDLCEQLAVGRTAFYTKIKALTGKTPNELLVGIRLKHAATLLDKKNHNIAEIAKMVGYQNPNYFSKSFKAYYGISPKEYQARK